MRKFQQQSTRKVQKKIAFKLNSTENLLIDGVEWPTNKKVKRFVAYSECVFLDSKTVI